MSSGTDQVPAGYRLKLDRAREHIAALEDKIGAFHARVPFEIYTEAEGGDQYWKVRIREQVPASLSTIVGDAIHNARAALDLLMVEIVRRSDPNRKSYNHVYFVIRESRAAFDADLGKATKGSTASDRAVIAKLRPYKGGNDAFWRLHQLDKLDKHKSLIPVGSSYQRVGFSHTFPGFPKEDGSVGDPIKTPHVYFPPADKLFPLFDGAIVFKEPLPLSIDPDVHFIFEVAFGHHQILDGEPVVPALNKVCDFVEGVIDTVERDLFHTP